MIEIGNDHSVGLEALVARHRLSAARGRGLLLALNLKQPLGPATAEAALQQGLLQAPRSAPSRFGTALTVTINEVDRMLAILDEVCCAMR